MAAWLVEKGVRSVAMQSTGVYWMPVFEVLEQHGLEVYLVNAQHTKNVPGRKSDIQECQWLLKLHAFGLLNNSFQPTDEIRVARTLWRHRGNLVAEASSTIQRMQKALIEMNVQLSNVLSDLSGVSGMRIIGAILEGQRDIAKSLVGNWFIKHGHQYVDKGTAYYEARYREQQTRALAKKVQKLGLQLVIPQTA